VRFLRVTDLPSIRRGTVRLNKQLKLPPVGRCIYCNSTENLSDEHALPYGLQGHLILPSASCKECAYIINSQIETPLMYQMLPSIRAALNLQSRSKKKKKPPRKFLLKIVGKDGSIRTVEVPVEDTIQWCFGLRMPVAGILANRPHDEREVPLDVVIGYTSERARGAADLKEAEQLQMPTPDIRVFIRFLAKVAHAQAVAGFGIDGFRHLLPSLILDKDVLGKASQLAPSYVIGDAPGWVPETTDIASIQHGLSIPDHDPSRRYAIIRFKLFSLMKGLPAYLIVAGESLHRPDDRDREWVQYTPLRRRA
jgi:hypothetical protein